MYFADRIDAGSRLARALEHHRHESTIVLALPRGGVPIGFEVSRALGVALDVFIVRKLGVPGHEELAMGAIASGGVTVLNHDVIAALALDESTIARVAQREWHELERRERLYRGNRPRPSLTGKTVILVDDGLATGASMRAAVQAVRALDPLAVVVAVPVAPATTCAAIGQIADEVVCLASPEPFFGIGQWYDDFHQLTDEDVRDLLEATEGHRPADPDPLSS